MVLSPEKLSPHRIASPQDVKMARDSHKLSHKDLNIDGQVISSLHRRPRKSTHFNTIRADRRASNGKTTATYITLSRNCIHEMRETGNIIDLKRGHMKLTHQARKTIDLVVSHPALTTKQRTKGLGTLGNILKGRKITRDQSILEVAADIIGISLSSLPSRRLRSQSKDQNVHVTPDPFVLVNVQPQSAQPPLQLANDDDSNDSRVSEALTAEEPEPSQHRLVRRAITLHGTEIVGGLVTPGVSPVKALGNRLIPTVGEQDVQMDVTFAGDRNSSPVPSPGSFHGSPQESLQPDPVAALQEKVLILTRENAELKEKDEYVRKKLSRNGNGTLSNIETITDRIVRQRDELRTENQKLRADIERLESGITNLQGEIARMQAKLAKAKEERIQMAQSKRRWIVRMWTLAGRLPGELRKKDAEINNMREKLFDMYARLAQEQANLREVQGQLCEERKRRKDVEAELEDSNAAHDLTMRERNLDRERFKDRLKHLVNDLESGAALL